MVTDHGLRQRAFDYLSKMKPLAVALDKLQSDTCRISDSVAIWKELQIAFDDMPLSVLSNFEERMSTALTPAHYLAHHLDPKYQTKNYLTDKDINTAMNFLQEYQPSALSSVLKYHAKSSPFL